VKSAFPQRQQVSLPAFSMLNAKEGVCEFYYSHLSLEYTLYQWRSHGGSDWG